MKVYHQEIKKKTFQRLLVVHFDNGGNAQQLRTLHATKLRNGSEQICIISPPNLYEDDILRRSFNTYLKPNHTKSYLVDAMVENYLIGDLRPLREERQKFIRPLKKENYSIFWGNVIVIYEQTLKDEFYKKLKDIFEEDVIFPNQRRIYVDSF